MICRNGHDSAASDYCDVCGTPLDAPTGVKPCPHCGASNAAAAYFCEHCGYDFTTGVLPPDAVLQDAPAPAAPAASTSAPTGASSLPSDDDPGTPVPPPAPRSGIQRGFVAELWVDPDWYRLQQSPDPIPSPGPPRIIPLSRVSMLIGRPSMRRGIAPDIDCEPDAGVSRRHAELSTDGRRWWLTDAGSANGTFVGRVDTPLPTEPIAGRVEIGPDDRIYVGSWTRICVRPAQPDEV